MNIYLVGYRGTGKTALSRAVALHMERLFVDTDELIVESEGMSVPEIFASEGEPRFRELETSILSELATRDDLVVATGGGIIGSEENRDIIKKTGLCIYLKASPDVIYSRISGDANRPALTQKSEREEIVTMLEKRKAWYEEVSQMNIDTGENNIRQCLDQITSFIQSQGVK